MIYQWFVYYVLSCLSIYPQLRLVIREESFFFLKFNQPDDQFWKDIWVWPHNEQLVSVHTTWNVLNSILLQMILCKQTGSRQFFWVGGSYYCTYILIRTLTTPDAPSSRACKECLEKNYRPKPLINVRRIIFNSHNKQIKEFTEFCNYGVSKDGLLRDWLVCRINDVRI